MTKPSQSPLTALIGVAMFGTVAIGCNTIRVPHVDYSFKVPLISLPLGFSSPTDRRADFAQVFCKALALDADYSNRECSDFIELDHFTPDGSALPPLLDNYQIIVVAGIFSACLPRAQVSIFKQGIAQLKREGMTHVEEILVSASGGTKEHAEAVAIHIRDHQDANRPFIAIGYSQGAADLLDAFVSYPIVRDSIKALITVAGAVGGSRLPDGIPRGLSHLLKDLNVTLPDCRISGIDGLDALRRQDRYDFLSAHMRQLPRSYSVAAKSTRTKTSAILQGPWKHLTAYSIDEDSQVIRDDAVVPGGAFLATAHADHWAVTLPFKEAHNPQFDRLIDQNAYPRTALLEAMVRFVMKDLKDHP